MPSESSIPTRFRRRWRPPKLRTRVRSAIGPISPTAIGSDDAFRALNARGVLALENAGLDQRDGYDEFRRTLAAEPGPERVIGYCFYHAQDVDSAIDGEGLYLAYGPRDPRDETTSGSAVGQVVVDELKAAGLAPRWNGDYRRRIHIPDFDWKRR